MSVLQGPITAMPLLYLDPGTGSFLIQMLIAAAVGIGVAVRLYWSKIKTVVTGKKSQPADTFDDVDEE